MEIVNIEEKQALVHYARQLNLPFINLSDYRLPKGIKDIIPEKFCRMYKVFPVSKYGSILTISITGSFT